MAYDMTPAESAGPTTATERMQRVGTELRSRFTAYEGERRPAEQRWLMNLRQFMGVYDPEIAERLTADRSKAYPKLTRIKCVSTVARIMNLMFPGNEHNWTLKASPAPDLAPEEAAQALTEAVEAYRAEGLQPELTEPFVRQAIDRFAQARVARLERHIRDQLEELGGDQTASYVRLAHQVLMSGTLYGTGVLLGPYVRAEKLPRWTLDATTQQPVRQEVERLKPHFEFLPVWDFYPDMQAKTLQAMDGYFVRRVQTRGQVRRLAQRPGFDKAAIDRVLQLHPNGNYHAKSFETELKAMGVSAMAQEAKPHGRYEVLTWHGLLDRATLQECGEKIPEALQDGDIEAEVWLVGDVVIRVAVNPWRKLGIQQQMVHAFIFEENDTSPLGMGLPQIMRDSQMAVAAAARMLLDNASVVCGPQLEVNLDLLREDQDISAIKPFKIWYRETTGSDAMVPAVRNITMDGHLNELQAVIELFRRFADDETFVGPATGGDMTRGMGEPMRTAAGASMLRGDAALPFKDIVRHYDQFTQSLILSLVKFNQKFATDPTLKGDVNVIARGATSLIAKEVRGIQIDTLAATLTPEERVHLDERKFLEARFAVRDLEDLLLPMDEVDRKQQAAAQQQQQVMAQQQEMVNAQIRETLSKAFKNIAQGQKNAAAADAQSVNAALAVLSSAMEQLMPAEMTPSPAGGGPTDE